MLAGGLDPLAANITSTIAMFPNQITSSLGGRRLAGPAAGMSLQRLFALSVAGGLCGALLLLNTPASFFARLVPWLVLFATSVFAWGSFRKKKLQAVHAMPLALLALIQFAIGVYGGYFGGGIGFLMLSALTVAGQDVRMATATKNVLAMAMNASAVLLFVFSRHVDWVSGSALALGGIAGGFAGNWLVHRMHEKALRGFVVLAGTVLTIWLFMR
jgi:uncharacterized membrane protein YfcA